MKKVFGIVLLIALVFTLTGCDLFNQSKDANGKVLAKPLKGNCNVFECINKIDTKDNLETVTKKMGFDGEKVKEESSYTTYKWVINEEKNETVQAVFYSTYTSLSITFKDEDLRNDKVDFSKYQEIKTAINNKEKVEYKDMVTKFGAEGALIEKSTSFSKYKWVDKDGKYLSATFSNNTGACISVFGRI